MSTAKKSSTATPPLAFLLADVVRLMRRDFRARASGLGLTPALSRLLFYVAREPGSRQADLAAVLDVTPVTLGRMVDKLAARGYVRRTPDPRTGARCASTWRPAASRSWRTWRRSRR